MTTRLAINALLISLAPVSAVYANDALEPWGQSGEWAILVDRDNGNGCLIQRDFDEGVRIRIGYVPDRDGGFFSALGKDWQQIEPGKTGVAKFISDRDKFAGEVDMVEEDGWYGGWAFFNNPEFTQELAQRRSITVIGPEGNAFDVDLAGSARAIREAERCQLAQD